VPLWIGAWALILVHFIAQLFETGATGVARAATATDMAALALASSVFTVSLMRAASAPRHRVPLLLVCGVPVVVYSLALAYQVNSRLLYLVCLAIAFYATVWAAQFYAPNTTRSEYGLLGGVALVGTWGLWRTLSHDFQFGYLAILTVGYSIPGLLFWLRLNRVSTGVVTTTGGFLCWGAVFPASTWLQAAFPSFQVNPELWNVPKLLVAFGMILVMVEDATARELAVTRQLQRFSELISRMLGGVGAEPACDQVAAAIVETSAFLRASVLLRSPQGLAVAGAYGWKDEELAALRLEVARLSESDIAAVANTGPRLGANSYFYRQPEQADLVSAAAGSVASSHPPCHVVVPLLSRRSGYLGCITLGGETEDDALNVESLSRIELLAADLAVALENEELQRHLVDTEKMAAMGRLVAGVAHELNNPLTAVLGYADLLGQDTEGRAQQQAAKLMREALRMKRIIANLLLFARQDRTERKQADLEKVLREVMGLREYHMQSLGIRIEPDIDPQLPPIAINEDHMRQVLLNLINNAVDAVAESEQKVIRVVGVPRGERVVVRVVDTGTGFPNIHQALDPFFTTKPVGKGTGLGLSIVYGIVKELGGDVVLENLDEGGAAVTIDLPALTAFYAAVNSGK
jgi:signal transduction histidine kinase